MPNFPSLHELNNEYNTEFGIDSQPDNTCIENLEEPIQGSPGNNTVDKYPIALDPRPDNLEMQPHILVPKIIASTDKLFVISFQEKSQHRREWKLIQLDLQKTMEQNPTALTDGRYIANPLIQHPSDSKLDIR